MPSTPVGPGDGSSVPSTPPQQLTFDKDDPEHPRLVEAHKFKTTRLTDTPEAEFGVAYSPDGKRVSFLRSGRLWTMNPDGSDPKAVVDEAQVFDYDWSPDSKWLVYAR